MNEKERSPFTPGNPVPIEFFVGRANQIEEILRYVRQSKRGKQENVFLAGERGIGKSSLASFIRYFVSSQENIFGIHVFLGKVKTLEELVRLILEQILKETKGQNWYHKINDFFGNYIREIGLFGVSISFNPPDKDLKELVRKFPEVINNLLEKIKQDKMGLFIALDDINGLVGTEDFANWYKSLVDEIATHYTDFPLFLMLIGLPEKRDALASLQPSLMRIFRVIDIEKLKNTEVEEFLIKAFREAEIEVTQEALRLMVQYSSGLPILMHEIGDATFWLDEDGVIDEKDAYKGIFSAAEKVGQKYLDPKVYRAIRSPRYRSILRKLGDYPLKKDFVKKDVEKNLNEGEKKVFHNFLKKIKQLGIIEADFEQGRGAYRFVNELYPIYIWMESIKASSK